MRKHLALLVVVLSLLVVLPAVYLTTWCCISWIRPLPLRVVFNAEVSPTHSSAASVWTRRVTDSVIAVDADGNFTDRVERFNVELHRLRQRLRLPSPGNTSKTTCRTSAADGRTANDGLGAGPLRVVSGAEENYIDELSGDPDIITVVLLWLRSRYNWSSLADLSNLPYQRYYEWTADNVLCSWIETPRVIQNRYDSMYPRTCNRIISDTAREQSLRPLYLHRKPINPNSYWPNNGDSYPEHFYTTTPPYVFYMHIYRDSVITELGDVITARTKLVLYTCSHDVTATLSFDEKLSQIPCYDEVYVISQDCGNEVFHRMAEIVPRLVFSLEFLKKHTKIRILGPEMGGRMAQLIEIIGLDKSRLISGVTRAKIVYQPRATGCGTANVQESQMLSRLYRDYIKRTFPSQPRNRLILIRRLESRRFTEQKAIEEFLQRSSRDYNLTYTLFIDNPTPSLNDTMMMFHSAVVIVAPVGAGEVNMFFSQPGTYVVEGVCNLPHVNLCFQWLAHVLGHHWHGVTSRGGCQTVVDVSAASVEDAVRSYLRVWMLELYS